MKDTAGHTSSGSQYGAKRITKNTVFLYTRTLVMMVVTLYTSRVTLRILGDEDFGIFNLVAGFVMMFSFLNFAMERASLRYILIEKGKNDITGMKRVFCVSLSVHLIIALIILMIGETAGLWFVNAKLNVPADKMGVTNIVYQFALLTSVFQVIRVPYNASIIAYERMSFYARFSIVEAVMRLAVVMLLMLTESDQLIIYSALWTAVTVIIFLCYRGFCLHNFSTCRYRWIHDPGLMKSMIAFSGWNMLGGAGNIGAQQGVAVILNIFFGAAINAAVGITNQVGNAINGVISSFQTAFNPKLVGLYARSELDALCSMLATVSKVSFYLTGFIVIPIILNINYILDFWLGKEDVPAYTAQFCIVYLIFYIIDAMSNPFWMANQATGKIKAYTVIWTILLLSNLPFCWIAFKTGMNPVTAFWIRTAINFIVFLFRVIYLKYQIRLSVRKIFLGSFILPVVLLCISFFPAWYVTGLFSGIAALILGTVTFFMVWSAVIYLLGLTKEERSFVRSLIRRKKQSA